MSPSTSSDTGALVVAGGVGIGGDLYVSGDIVANKLTVQLTTVTTTYVITDDIISTYNTTNSSDTTSGALVVAGGVGIGRNVNIGGDAALGGVLYASSFIVGDDSRVNGRLRVNGTATSIDTQTGALVVVGGVGIGGDLHVGNIFSNGSQVLTSTDGSPSFVSKILPGSDISVDTGTGVVTISDISTLDSVASRGSSTTYAITLLNDVDTTSSDSGSLIVRGGIGVGKSIYSDGDLHAASIQIAGVSSSTISGQLGVNQLFVTSTENAYDFDTGAFRTPGGISVRGNIVSGGDIYANGYLVNTGTFTGGSLSTKTTITSDENAISTNTGAFQVVGGVGIGRDIFAGGKITANNIQITGSTTSNISGTLNVTDLKVTDGADTSSVDTGALQVTGGVGIGGSLYVGGTVTATNFSGNFNGYFSGTIVATGTVTTATCATNIIGGSTGDLLYQIGPSQTGFVTATAPGQILVSGATTPVYQNTLALSGNTTSTDVFSGALTVVGGVGIGQDLFVGQSINGDNLQVTGYGTSVFNGTVNASFINVTYPLNADSSTSGSLIVTGGAGIAQDLYVGGSVYIDGSLSVSTSTIGNSAVTKIIAGADISVSGNTGQVTVSNTSTLQTVTDRGNSTTNAISITNSTNSDSTNSGALQVTGGAGIGGNVYIGGNLDVTGAIVGGALVVTTATIVTQAATSITAGTDTAVNTSTGAIIIWNTSTLESVTSRGNITSSAISITNTSISTTTDSGALIISGGVGIAGDVYLGGTLYGIAQNAENIISQPTDVSAPYYVGLTTNVGMSTPISSDYALSYVTTSSTTSSFWTPGTNMLNVPGSIYSIDGSSDFGNLLYTPKATVGPIPHMNPRPCDFWVDPSSSAIYQWILDQGNGYWLQIAII